MAISQAFIEALQKAIGDKNNAPTINKLLTSSLTGGWEGWLQVAYALAVLSSGIGSDFDNSREQKFTGTGLRCDLKFTQPSGVPIWLELKTQRNKDYKNTVPDFVADMNKIKALSLAFLQGNVVLAAAVMRLDHDEPNQLNALRTNDLARLKYLLFDPTGPKAWQTVTDEIAGTKTGVGQVLLATYRAN